MDQEQFKTTIARRCISFDIGGFRPPESSDASWFGKVMLALPKEKWPYSNGNPMIPLAQINVDDLPFRTKGLENIAFISLFIDSKQLPTDTPSNGEGWLIRSYKDISALVEVESPLYESHIKPFPMRAVIVEHDYPCLDDMPCEIPEDIEDRYYDIYENVGGFKLGGWPSLIQSEIFWAPNNEHPAKPEYIFQIDSEPKANWGWGHGGVGYFGRGTEKNHENEWTLEWQCY